MKAPYPRPSPTSKHCGAGTCGAPDARRWYVRRAPDARSMTPPHPASARCCGAAARTKNELAPAKFTTLVYVAPPRAPRDAGECGDAQWVGVVTGRRGGARRARGGWGTGGRRRFGGGTDRKTATNPAVPLASAHHLRDADSRLCSSAHRLPRARAWRQEARSGQAASRPPSSAAAAALRFTRSRRERWAAAMGVLNTVAANTACGLSVSGRAKKWRPTKRPEDKGRREEEWAGMDGRSEGEWEGSLIGNGGFRGEVFALME